MKARGAIRIRYPSSPGRKRCVQDVAQSSRLCSVATKVLSTGSTTRGAACGLIEFNAGNLTRGDGRMKDSLKGFPDEPRGAAWPASARAVRCPVKSGNERDLHSYLPPCPQGRASTIRRLLRKRRGRCRLRQVCTARISWATRAQQWLGQWDATPKGEAKPRNPILVRIEGCNSPS